MRGGEGCSSQSLCGEAYSVLPGPDLFGGHEAEVVLQAHGRHELPFRICQRLDPLPDSICGHLRWQGSGGQLCRHVMQEAAFSGLVVRDLDPELVHGVPEELADLCWVLAPGTAGQVAQ